MWSRPCIGTGRVLHAYARTQGARVDVVHPKTGLTPLLAAIENGHVKLVRVLVGAGADVNTRNRVVRTV